VDRLEFGGLVVKEISEAFYFDDPEAGVTDTTIDTVVALSNGSVLVLEGVADFLAFQNVAPSGPDPVYSVAANTGFNAPPVLEVNLLAGLEDPNGDPISVDLSTISGVFYGTFDISDDGTFIYRPDLYASGQDRFSFVPTDGTDAGRRITVTIDVVRPDNLGTDGPDRLEAPAEGGQLAGWSGADELIGGPGDDVLAGGAGPDLLVLGGGADEVRGSAFELDGDTIEGFGPDDVIFVPLASVLDLSVEVQGDDLLLTLDQAQTVTFRDLPADTSFVQREVEGGLEIRLVVEDDVTSVLSRSADRLVSASDVPLTIFADRGDDAVAGGSAGDILLGGPGNDVIFGGPGDDILDGGAGYNVLVGGPGADIFVVDPMRSNGFDSFTIIRDFTPGEDVIELVLQNNPTFDDLVFLDNGERTVLSDILALEGVRQAALGAADFRFSVRNANGAVEGAAALNVLTEASDTFVVTRPDGVEVQALGGDDVVLGAAGDDTLLGGGGDDALNGRGGADLIDGGAGENRLTGGAGPDVFRLRDTGGVPTRDILTDFTLGVDRIVLDALPGITTLEDALRRDTAEGLEFDLGAGRTLVLPGLTSAEVFDATDIEVIPGPAAPVAAAASVAVPETVEGSQQAATTQTAGAPEPFEIRAWTVSVGAYDANTIPGVGARQDLRLSGPISVTVEDADRLLDPEALSETRITIDGDAQGPVTSLSYEAISYVNSFGFTRVEQVAVIGRAFTADYLIVPIDVETASLSTLGLPTETAIVRTDFPVDLPGPLSLITDVEAAGGLLARPDRFQIDETGTVTLDVLRNDADLDDDPITITGVTQPAEGSVSTDGSALFFTPAAGQVGTLTLTYDIADGTGLTSTGEVRLDVLPEGYTLLETPPGSTIVVPTDAPELVVLETPGTIYFATQLASLDGDLVQGFSDDMVLRVQLPGIEVTDISVGATETVLTFADAATPENTATLTVLGDYSGEMFRISNRPTSTEVRLTDSGVMLTEANDRFVAAATEAGAIIDGEGGNDAILGTGGGDILVGGSGADVILGSGGDDFLFPGTGADSMTGGAGADTFFVDLGDFTPGAFELKTIADFETSMDRLEISGFAAPTFEDLAFVPLAGGDAIQLTPTHFLLFDGLTAADLDPGDITIQSQAGRGFDLFSSPVVHRLTDGNDRFITQDAAANEVRAGAGLDVVIGGAGADVLFGEAGSDVLIGGQGPDRLIGGQGSDRLTGGSEADVFVLIAGEETGVAAETIADFVVGTDRVELQGFDAEETQVSFLEGPNLIAQITPTRFVIFEGYSAEAELGSLEDVFDFV
jgi:Ca2+-binding RTX toxin-like protein